MSQAKNDRDDSRQQAGASQSLDRMIRQGRSFSGRERHCVFLNTLAAGGHGDRFAMISAVSGLDFPDDGRALAYVDWDHDGDLDLWFSNRNAPRLRFLRNDISGKNHFIQLRLMGNGVETNRNGIGARVTIVLKDSGNGAPSKLIKTLRAGEGFLAQSSSWLHFGLGDSAEIEQVTVRWPNQSGDAENFGPLVANRRYELVQGASNPQALPNEPRQLAIKSSTLNVPPQANKHRIPLVYSLPPPRLGYFDFEGRPHEFELGSQHVTLVNLWSTTCQPCVEELAEFARRADELETAGIRILAISIDALQSDDPQATSSAKGLVDRLEMPFVTGMAPPGVMDQLQRLHNTVINLERPLPLPTSFLIDRNGRLDIIYKGPVEVDTLLADARDVQFGPLERLQRAAAFPGTAIDNDIINSPTMQAGIHFSVARQLLKLGKTDQAIAEYREAEKQAPDSAIVHNDIGVLFMRQSKIDLAAEHFVRAVELDPDDVGMRINLARVLTAQGKNEEAREQLTHAVESLDPNHAEARFHLGVLLTQEKEFAQAQIHFETAVECDPNHAGAHYSLGNLYERNRQFDSAKKHYLHAHEIAPNEPVIATSLGKLYLRDGGLTNATKYFRRAIDSQPRYAEAHYQLGLVFMERKQYQAARQEFEATLRYDAGHAEARAALQQALLSE